MTNTRVDLDGIEVARFYTRSRRFPKMIGRMHDGTRIWGGPYTITQAFVGASVFLLAMITRAQWGSGFILADIPMAIVFAGAATYGAGFIPSTRRNLFNVVGGAWGAMRKPFDGRYQGGTFRLRAPHRVGGRVHFGAVTAHMVTDLVAAPTRTRTKTAPAPQPELESEFDLLLAGPPSAAPSTPGRGRPITAVEHLLEQARAR